MHPNEALIRQLYTGLQDLDGEAMAACYHPQAQFSDPVFPDLKGAAVGGMWRMLCQSATDLSVSFRDIRANDNTGQGHVEAVYTFSTGRKVHNSIASRFEFLDGKIIRQKDDFNFWRWSRMTLGVTGFMLGWAPWLQRKVQKRAARQLEHYLARKSV
ncbi:MAG: nuclear transport factor 2 family protein [Candidatus Marinimicrobia bacterium]|nr:nuclear transport factor 2 family protein [Candidatus Neomarinimicrobiota bacterium]MCF7840732.1 nuclear transport factor 2 family protein [Candidatus Neomarinimicrobiota bacterium]MCF7902709.1 nuclear transport factor 2 family protein [Candidatus Neomarinimicrobiota bacterium]